jgi:hypothetical protein
MSPLTVFIRTLLKSSAIFVGTVVVFLHPQLEFRSATGVGARPSPRQQMVTGLVAALNDPDAGVRRQVAQTLGHVGDAEVLEALKHALRDADASVRCAAANAVARITRQ